MMFADSDDALSIESRLEKTLSAMEGAGKVTVMINSDSDGRVTGVLVVSEGAADIGVRLELQEAVCRVLGVDVGCVGVVRMEGG